MMQRIRVRAIPGGFRAVIHMGDGSRHTIFGTELGKVADQGRLALRIHHERRGRRAIRTRERGQ